jgi:hypothetical protein
MGTKQISINEIKITDKSNIIDDKIVFEDLVRTLQNDSSKYIQPILNSNDELIENGIYVLAAKEANISYLIVETPGNIHFKDRKYMTDTILKKQVFFKNDVFEKADIPYLNEIFNNYFKRCKTAVEKSGMNKGTVSFVNYSPSNDLITYILRGRLNEPEKLDIFADAERTLHTNLEIIVGKINSVNGIKYLPYG